MKKCRIEVDVDTPKAQMLSLLENDYIREGSDVDTTWVGASAELVEEIKLSWLFQIKTISDAEVMLQPNTEKISPDAPLTLELDKTVIVTLLADTTSHTVTLRANDNAATS